ncbi:activator of Hsp90 ATPase [Cladochytrium replicatum]|nr:activator of Hsp90 ATPase [Cladochytrium replicatum]
MAATSSTNWKNVNNWHWVEKNCIVWTKDYITQKFTAVQAEVDGTKYAVTEVSDVSGDVNLNQRKGKIITIYELNIEAHWKGYLPDGSSVSGKIKFSEFEHDIDVKDVPVEITSEDSGNHTNNIKKHVLPQLHLTLASFADDLKQSHSKDVYIAPEDMKGHPVKKQYQPKPPAPEVNSGSTSATQSSLKGSTTTVKMETEFVCTAEDLYDVFVNVGKASAWSRGQAIFTPAPGGEFQLFGGNVSGKFVELVPNEKIVQTWRLKSWPSDHYSQVTLTFKQGDESTILSLSQTGVPIGDKDMTRSNWQNYYWNGIKGAFGYGALL